MKAIVAIDKKSAIGYQGKLLYHLHEDMVHFNKLTTGNTIIYGINTLETFPNKQPLKNRRNIILTTKDIEIPNAIVCHSVYEALSNINLLEENYVIGGSRIYREFYKFLDTIYVTQIYDTSKLADSYFIDINLFSEWSVIDTSEMMLDGGTSFKFLTYHRNDLIDNEHLISKIINELSIFNSFQTMYPKIVNEAIKVGISSPYSTLTVTLQILLAELERYRTNL